jgi:hypothetical protein
MACVRLKSCRFSADIFTYYQQTSPMWQKVYFTFHISHFSHWLSHSLCTTPLSFLNAKSGILTFFWNNSFSLEQYATCNNCKDSLYTFENIELVTLVLVSPNENTSFKQQSSSVYDDVIVAFQIRAMRWKPMVSIICPIHQQILPPGNFFITLLFVYVIWCSSFSLVAVPCPKWIFWNTLKNLTRLFLGDVLTIHYALFHPSIPVWLLLEYCVQSVHLQYVAASN